MKSPFSLCLALIVAAPVFAEDEKTAQGATPAADVAAKAVTTQQPPAKLDELLGPIALYPDALVALILPASTVPSDIVLAARFLNDGGKIDEVENEPWDDSVKSLARYPDIVKWMDTNLAWTKQMGEAFSAQPADVMNSVQRLRAKAKANGSLVDTPQQKVIVEDESIVIAPAEPDVIYVPYYDPQVVYVERVRYVSDPFITFGIGYSTGWWLGYGVDWHHRRVWCVEPSYRRTYWDNRYVHNRTYHRPDYRGDPHFQPWRPRPGYPRGPRYDSNPGHVHREISRPAPFPRRAEMPRSRLNSATGDTVQPVANAPVNNRSQRPNGGMPHRSGSPRQIVPQTSPSVSGVPATAIAEINSQNAPANANRTPRAERSRQPRIDQGEPRSDANSPAQTTTIQPRPERERSSPPPTGRTGMPRENRPEPRSEIRQERQSMPRSEPSSAPERSYRPEPRVERAPPPSSSSSDSSSAVNGRRPLDSTRETPEREQR
ncbi:DUF3300 domain-containing protein [Oleiharenicola lentus]|uniref:DUF3300 domain-containing protein n=1 Tax=Oleiharenicola lentus TaxID=2508720 RepID=UPI003F67799D